MRITGHTRVAAVIGDPVRHSLSPVIHNAAFRALELDWLYVAHEVPAGSGAAAVAAMRTLGIGGLNVTMPLKAEVAAAVDVLSPAAAALGAVNTVLWRGAELYGDNTDAAGFLDAVRIDEGFDPAGARCTVFGGGGAARAVCHALGAAGAAEVVVVNRTPQRAETAAALAGPVGRAATAAEAAEAAEAGGCDLIVNATPLGMRGEAATHLPLEAELITAGALVVDLVYDPPVTPLIEAARAAGAVAVNGIGMLVHQAAHAFRLFTGEPPPLEVMSAAVLAELRARQPAAESD